ncbi:large conductance mechanosensitive channel protein MscL [Streptomyces sp. NPDC005438]|uniref:large conductance mechanosensitive channel protein MscL n=1 Tax=Streptomyces sp. NPDC005438 TaxID=3156880 RepID=UPI0033B28CCB
MSEEKPSVWSGFREFLLRGNVVELAVAVVVGTAFSKIVDAVVNGLINPLVGAIGTKDLDGYELCLRGCGKSDGVAEVTLKWGPVLSASITFLCTAAVVYFLMIMPMNKYKERRAAMSPPEPLAPTEVELLTEIRDHLVGQRQPQAVETADDTVSSSPGGGGVPPQK